MVKVLMLGDVVSSEGCDYLNKQRRLASFVSAEKIDLVIANGENSAEGNGISPDSAERLFDAGVDVITGGNHSWKRREAANLLEDRETVLRPANYPDAAAGHGYCLVDAKGYRVLVLDLAGCVSMSPLDSPFTAADRILQKEKGKYDLAVVEIHAEATSEKLAMGRFLDGRVAVVAGTHTHVQTADAQILPGGTGYITDLGMSGSHDGILGVKTEAILHSFLVKTPVVFEAAKGNDYATGCIFSLDPSSCRCVEVKAIQL